MKPIIHKLTSVIIILILLMSSLFAIPAMAAEADSWKTVKVACNINNSLYLDKNGNAVGYCNDYLNQLAIINHWKLEYVPASWSESVQNLYDGKIDLLFPTQMIDERIGKMNFSTAIGGYQPIGLFAKSDSKYCYDDFEAFDGARVALSAGTSNEAAMNAYAEENGFTYTPVYLNTTQDKEEALMNGTVDLIVFSTLNDVKDSKVVAMLDYLPFYYCTNINDTELLDELNYGMKQMLLRQPDLVQEVFYSFMSKDISFAYTKQEQTTIKKHGKITIGLYEDTEPLFSVDSNGEYEGIYVDLINRVAEISGLELEIMPLNRSEIVFDYLDTGKIDFVLGSSDQALKYIDKKGYIQSEGIMDYYTISITKSTFDKAETAKTVFALTNGRSSWESVILKQNPNATFKYYLSSKDCLDAVTSGKADITLLNSWEFNYQSKNQRYEDLIEWENSRTLSQSVFISQGDEDSDIMSVINKAIEQISNSEKERYITANLNRPYSSYEFFDRMYEAKQTIFIFGSIMLIVLVGLAIFIIMRRRTTRALQNKNKELQESNEAKDLFLSRMSHELRTPLNAINGYTAVMEQNLSEHTFDEQQSRSYLASISRAVKYQLAIIGDLLDIQRIESGKLELIPQEVGIKNYMENIVALISPEAQENGIELQYKRISDSDDTYHIDGVRFQQVLLNILHNAVKFTPQGGKITMTSEIIDCSETSNTLKFTISDTGIGMSKDFQQNYLFRKFAQEYKGNTSPYEGCGTGLAISKEIIHMMGGEITCTSEQGVGSTFTVILTAKIIENNKKHKSKFDYSSIDLGGIRVLLCEDNKMNQEIEKRLLERINAVVDIADDGQIGLDMFSGSEEGTYKLVLMDIRMPNMDGLIATRAIRALNRDDAKTVPIIAVSANSFEEDVKKSLAAGMNEHLAKPVNVDLLYKKVVEYCQNKKETP